MIELKTTRLRLICPEFEDMKLSGESIWKYEDKLGLAHSIPTDHGDELAAEFCGAYQYHLNQHTPMNLMWLRIWNFIHIEHNRLIGGACFKGGPYENGEVEIGYGIDDAYQNQGYATEAIASLVEWAHQQEGVSYVTAETLKDNISSQKVLQKIGMVQYSENDENYYWKL